MLALHDVHRAEPIYLCGTHAREIGLSATASASETKSPESAPLRITFKPPAANSSSALDAPHGRRRWYILLLVAGLALAGGLLGPRLFRGSPVRSRKPVAMAKPRKAPAGNTLPQKAPRKDQAAAPQKQSQPVPKQPAPKRSTRKNAQPATRSVQSADVAAKGTIARRVVPDVPKSASNTIRGTILVSVRVQVNAKGDVEHTELVFRGPSRYFARLSIEAARRWKFHPPVIAGKNSPSEWLIRFYFTRKATSADASVELRAGTRRK